MFTKMYEQSLPLKTIFKEPISPTLAKALNISVSATTTFITLL